MSEKLTQGQMSEGVGDWMLVDLTWSDIVMSAPLVKLVWFCKPGVALHPRLQDRTSFGD